MDPLFGFHGFPDDMVEQQVPGQGQTQGEESEYTISFPVMDQNQSYSSQLQGNAQLGTTSNATVAQSNQVVHVVSETSSNAKQVYVIKLENILRDDKGGAEEEGNSNLQQMTINQGQPQELQIIKEEPVSADEADSPVSSSGDSEDENREKDETGEEDEDSGPDPFLVVSPEAVMAMAQSIGVELGEELASELGCIAMNKLRHVVLVALQFAQNENSEGITVEHFAKAEEQMGSVSSGHESVFRETAFKYAGGVSVLDDGPEIDLYTAIRQSEDTELSIDVAEPTLNVHHLRAYDYSQNEKKMDFPMLEEPVGECVAGGLEENVDSVEVENNNDVQSIDASRADNMDENSEDEISEVTNLTENVLREIENGKNGQQTTNDLKNQLQSGDNNLKETFAKEWAPYLQLFFDEMLSHNYKRDFNFYEKSNFQKILEDIRQNGLHSVFNVVCDASQDYLRQNKISLPTLMNILAVLDALVSSRCEPTSEQLNEIGSTLIEMIILPPPCEVHNLLSHIFMKVLKKCNELLTWTCTYVTEMLKGISETPLDQLLDAFKSTMHGALCLVNGLEDLKIQVAQEFGWHTSVLAFINKYCAVFEGEAYNPSSQDSYLEEEILKFYHNFLNNYTGLVPAQELTKIREMVESVYGEKFITFVPPFSMSEKTVSAINNKNSTDRKKVRCIFKKINYKNREIIIRKKTK